eukprot:TRINITY_DN11517_c0_g1_i1.p1 TRINITY_DN11517_c0_g1~~TRINITY_DN11517_c0_g1_i1.p1  ORF type:complete len:375 (+),score=94.26 TRINITY_DN11517_c0_g1_i1:83-1207(+)
MSIELEKQVLLPVFEFDVSDPEIVNKSGTNYAIYTIRTKITYLDGQSSNYSIQRRFNDFLWLQDQLRLNPGCIVPPLPERHAFGRYEEKVIRDRQQIFTRFLTSVSKHRILAEDKHFFSFVTMGAADFEQLVHATQITKPVVKDLSEFVANSPPPPADFDLSYEKHGQRLVTLQRGLETTCEAAKKSVIAHRNISVCNGELTQALSDHSIHESDMKLKLILEGICMRLRQQIFQSDFFASEVRNMFDQFTYNSKLVAAVQDALRARVTATTQLYQIEKLLEAKKAKVDEAAREPKGKKTEKVQQEYDETLLEKERANMFLEQTNYILPGELGRFEEEKVVELHQTIYEFAQINAQYYEKTVADWQLLLKDLQKE